MFSAQPQQAPLYLFSICSQHNRIVQTYTCNVCVCVCGQYSLQEPGQSGSFSLMAVVYTGVRQALKLHSHQVEIGKMCHVYDLQGFTSSYISRRQQCSSTHFTDQPENYTELQQSHPFFFFFFCSPSHFFKELVRLCLNVGAIKLLSYSITMPVHQG